MNFDDVTTKKDIYFSLYNGLAGDPHLLLKAVDSNNNKLYSELWHRSASLPDWINKIRLGFAKSRIIQNLEHEYPDVEINEANDIDIHDQYKVGTEELHRSI